MKPKTLVLLTVAAGCGLLAMLGIQQAMQGGQAAAAVPKTKVLVAAQDILPGVVLTPELVTFKEMPGHVRSGRRDLQRRGIRRAGPDLSGHGRRHHPKVETE